MCELKLFIILAIQMQGQEGREILVSKKGTQQAKAEGLDSVPSH